MEVIHGGDWAGYQEEYGALPLDFSANISPLGLPEGVRRAAAEALGQSDRYPDPLCRRLCRCLARCHGVAASRIVCGNGAADLIWRLAVAAGPKTALVTAPGFAEYERALAAVNCRRERLWLQEAEDFAVTEEIFPHLAGKDMVFLCQPNNPTGRTVEPALLREIAARCDAAGTVLVVDECFVDFLDRPEDCSLVPVLGRYENLVILRAFTKFYAMPGLRLGYALCGSENMAERLRRSGQPWPVSLPAQAAGVAALGERDYAAAVRTLIARERPRLAAGLAALDCHVVPGEGNYLLFSCPDRELGDKLRRRGILLRDCGNFAGLGPGWYRTAVRTAEENGALLRAMEEVRRGG